MKTNSCKNKNPILLKFFQISALLIGSAFFTAQAENKYSFDTSNFDPTPKFDPSPWGPILPPGSFDPEPVATVSLYKVNVWEQEGNCSAFNAPFEIILDDPQVEDYFTTDTILPYEITIEYDSRKISIDNDTSGSVTFSGNYPNFHEESAVNLFTVSTFVTLNTTTLRISSATLDGVPLIIEDYDLELPTEPSCVY